MKVKRMVANVGVSDTAVAKHFYPRGSAVSGVQWTSFHSIASPGGSGPVRAALSQCFLLARLWVLAMLKSPLSPVEFSVDRLRH
jgi:hypothetical protein